MPILFKAPTNPSDIKQVKEMRIDLFEQMQENKREGRIRQDMGFSEYLMRCFETLEDRKKEIKVMLQNGNLDKLAYNNDLDVIKETQDTIKRIDSDNPISVLQGRRIE